MRYRHIPVMVKEVIDYLDCSPGKTYVDGTLGGGGHAQAILRAVGPDGFLIGIDQDPVAVSSAREALQQFKSNIRIFHDNFTGLPDILSRLDITGVDGVLLDLGVSLYQLERSGRGFSFMRDEPLDMRMNPWEGEPAETLINRLPEKALATVIARHGEERWARRVAKTIVRQRGHRPIQSSLHLAEIVKSAIPARYRPRRIHPATRTFQALRIEVNQELKSLGMFLEGVAEVLNKGGRLCILSYHSLEDRIVKDCFRSLARGCECPKDFPVCVCEKRPQVHILTKRPVQPDPEEVRVNPMARSAKLRAVERIQGDKQ
jgi:16S rRNA (cytosine1402-N4)-methyltransferase